MIKTIVFDFGGVLGSNSNETFIELLAKYGLDEEIAMEILKAHWPKLKTGAEDTTALWRAVRERLDLPAPNLAEEYNELITVDDAVLAVCRELKARGYQLGILANDSAEWIEIKRQNGRLNEIFAVVYSSADIQAYKPQPEAYQKILKALGARPEETLFIDNLERNLPAAEALGMATILFKDVGQLKMELGKVLGE